MNAQLHMNGSISFAICEMEYYVAARKDKIIQSAVTQIEPEGVMLSEVSEKENDRCRMISLMYGIQRCIARRH